MVRSETPISLWELGARGACHTVQGFTGGTIGAPKAPNQKLQCHRGPQSRFPTVFSCRKADMKGLWESDIIIPMTEVPSVGDYIRPPTSRWAPWALRKPVGLTGSSEAGESDRPVWTPTAYIVIGRSDFKPWMSVAKPPTCSWRLSDRYPNEPLSCHMQSRTLNLAEVRTINEILMVTFEALQWTGRERENIIVSHASESAI